MERIVKEYERLLRVVRVVREVQGGSGGKSEEYIQNAVSQFKKFKRYEKNLFESTGYTSVESFFRDMPKIIVTDVVEDDGISFILEDREDLGEFNVGSYTGDGFEDVYCICGIFNSKGHMALLAEFSSFNMILLYLESRMNSYDNYTIEEGDMFEDISKKIHDNPKMYDLKKRGKKRGKKHVRDDVRKRSREEEDYADMVVEFDAERLENTLGMSLEEINRIFLDIGLNNVELFMERMPKMTITGVNQDGVTFVLTDAPNGNYTLNYDFSYEASYVYINGDEIFVDGPVYVVTFEGLDGVQVSLDYDGIFMEFEDVVKFLNTRINEYVMGHDVMGYRKMAKY